MARRKSEDWLSVPAVMKRLGLSRAGVYKAVNDGRLRARKLMVTSELLRIDPESVAGFEVSKSHQKRGKRAARIKYAPKR
jgi:hypothetical protein